MNSHESDVQFALPSALLTARSPSEVYRAVTKVLGAEFDAEFAGVTLNTDRGPELMASTVNLDRTTWDSQFPQLFVHVSGVAHADKPLVVSDLTLTRGAATASGEGPSIGPPVRSLVATPLQREGNPLTNGVMFAGSTEADRFTEDDLDRLDDFAELVATTLERFDFLDGELLGAAHPHDGDALDLALDAGRAILFTSDSESRTIDSLQGAVEVLCGSATDEVRDLAMIVQRIHPDDRNDVSNLFDQIADGEIDRFECVSRLVESESDSDSDWVRVVATTKITNTGRVIAGMVVDTTATNRQLRELEQRIDQFQRLINVVDHDVRSLLNVANGQLELAEEEFECKHVSSSRRVLERIGNLIESSVSLAEVDSEAISTTRIDLRRLSERSWEMVETADAMLEVKTERAISADRSQLRQLLENLYRNAVEHGGTDVTVTVGELDDRTGFYVEDTGPGIPEGDCEKALESGYSTSDTGTGFGLAIVNGVVDSHGWTIDLTESKSGGLRVEVSGVKSEHEEEIPST